VGGGRLTTHLPGHGGRVLSTSPPMGGLTSEGPERVGRPLNRRSVERLRFGSLNVGTMKGRSGEIAECVGRRNLDFCCLQETKWKGQGARFLEGDREGNRYKFFWVGCKEDKKGNAGVGVMVAEKWENKIIEVRRINERLMMVRIAIGERVINVVSAYAPHSGWSLKDKEEFWLLMLNLLTSIKAEESVIVGGDMNGHVGHDVEGFEGVHGGNGYGVRNIEGEMLLELAMAMDLVVCNTFFRKEDNKKVTFESSGNKSEIDYFMVRRKEKGTVKDVTVINGETCVTQHKLLLCKLEFNDKLTKWQKQRVSDRCCLWKLKEEGTRAKFRDEIKVVADKRTNGNVDSMWTEFRECLITTADKTCGRAKRKNKKRVTWWWNKEVSDVVKRKRKLYRVAHRTKTDEDREAYNTAKREAKIAVAKAKESESRRYGEMLDKEDGRKNIFRIAKQMVNQNKDVIGSSYIKGKDGNIITDESKVRQTWKEYFDKLLNEEFDWDRSCITNEEAEHGVVCERITPDEVRAAVKGMKVGKAAGPSGVVSEMLKSAGEDGVLWMTDLFNQIIAEGKVPADWRKSWIVTVYKGKGDALDCNSYRGIKILDQAMKVFEKVIEKRVRSQVTLDDMQFGFRPGKGTTDAIFIVRQIQERYIRKNKEVWMAFVDLEKAFDRVPREILWWSLRQLKVDEGLVAVIKSMYDNVTTAVKVNGKVSEEFQVKVGVHQGSVLSPLLFTIVLEAISKHFRRGLPWELL
jgi:hypothetical protein